MKFDLHMHTARHSPDADSDPFELVRAALKAGLDGIVITEHDYVWTEEELDELRAAAPGLVIIAGVEVTGRGGDVLCYGVSDPFTVPKGIEWPKLCREVHLAEQRPELDGIEVMSNNMDPDLRARAQELLAKYPHFAQLGNSDSHQPNTVGCCYTDFDAEIRTSADLVAAIRAGKGVARVNDAHRA
jgi:predicted metal-dependent phosphoesterase TrpH